MKNRSIIPLIIAIFVFITSCKKTEIAVIEDPIIDNQVFRATPLTDEGMYNGFTTALGVTDEHINNAPVIEPINGKIGLAILGASNSKYEGDVIIEKINAMSVNPGLVVKNCATSSKDINDWADPANACWYNAMNALGDITPDQIQIVWFQTDDLYTTSTDFPGEPLDLKDKIIESIKLMNESFPNLKQVYGSGRSYTGYADPVQHKEPKGYYTGWAWKWVVEDQINGLLSSDMPWISDEIYLWTNGEEVRSDGFQILQGEYSPGGVHLTDSGNGKVADYLIQKFQTMPSSSSWFNLFSQN